MVVGKDTPGSLDLARGPARGAWAPAARAGRSLKGAEGQEKPQGQAVRLEGWWWPRPPWGCGRGTR